MNPEVHSSKPLSAVRGAIILILVAIPLRMIGSVEVPWFALKGSADPAACVYQVIQDEACLGTVHMKEASRLSQILVRVGASPRGALDEEDTALPCNCVIRLERKQPPRVQRMSGRHLVCAGQRIDINVAEAKDFTALPGIGPALAARIVQHRDLHGTFTDARDLQRVPGIGRKRMAAIAPFIEVNRVTPGLPASGRPGRAPSVSPSTRVAQTPDPTLP